MVIIGLKLQNILSIELSRMLNLNGIYSTRDSKKNQHQKELLGICPSYADKVNIMPKIPNGLQKKSNATTKV